MTPKQVETWNAMEPAERKAMILRRDDAFRSDKWAHVVDRIASHRVEELSRLQVRMVATILQAEGIH